MSDVDASVDLRGRIAKVLKDFAPAMPKPEIVWCADAIITEIAAFRLEVSEDEFLDAVIAENDGTCCAPLVSDNE